MSVAMTDRAGAFLKSGMNRASTRAEDLARDADAQFERLTGKPFDAWVTETRRIVRDHPFGAIAVTIGIGYVLGKLMKRG